MNRLFLEGAIYERAPIREKYKKRFDAYPGSLNDEYLYARTLVDSIPKRRCRFFQRFLQGMLIIHGSITPSLRFIALLRFVIRRSYSPTLRTSPASAHRGLSRTAI